MLHLFWWEILTIVDGCAWLLAQKQLVSGVIAFFPMRVAQLVQKMAELRFVFRSDLDAHQDPTIG